jgi:site-specific DNA-methyltransferase (adenine-specific)
MLIANCLNQCPTIIDPFAGSGTTLAAARSIGKPAVGIEQNEELCAAIVERLRQGDLPLTG